MAKRSQPSRLNAEERQLEEQREQLLRKQEELRVRLQRLPAVIAEQEAEQRKRRAAAAAPAISLHGGRAGGRRLRSGRTRAMQTPRREQWITQLKTFGWIIILGIIGYMLYQIIPAPN